MVEEPLCNETINVHMQTQRGLQAGLNNQGQNGAQLKPDLQHVTCPSRSHFTTFFFFFLSDLGLCHSFGSMWTPLVCVKSSSVTPETLMGKSWHLAVNDLLYSAEHLSRDQGLSLIWAFSLKCVVWVRLMSLGAMLQKH